MAKFKLDIHAEQCKGCGVCVSVCPKKILGISKHVNQKGYSPAAILDEDACIGCVSCALMCPDGAIEIYQAD